jgi:hypothetical protein
VVVGSFDELDKLSAAVKGKIALFEVHHTHADSFDWVDPDDLADNTATLASFAYALAQSDVSFR